MCVRQILWKFEILALVDFFEHMFAFIWGIWNKLWSTAIENVHWSNPNLLVYSVPLVDRDAGSPMKEDLER